MSVEVAKKSKPKNRELGLSFFSSSESSASK